MNYFSICKTLNEVKQLYRTLAKENHPDKGGILEVMQAINNQYTIAIAKLAKGENLTESEIENEIVNAEAYKDAINSIINIEGIFIEICGGWIWVTGNTYPVRQTLKENCFMFASKKCAWYFRSVEYKVNSRKKLSLDDIRTKYGSISIGSKMSYQLSY